MKPPPRRRATPARYLGETTRPPAWSAREKRQLLRLLQARREQPEPDAADLARELPGRSAEEIQTFIELLKSRVVREAIKRLRPGSPRPEDRQTPAPIEVWLDLAEKLSGPPLEEALSTAFSQVLTIAATEPLSLLHSKPPKTTKAREPQLFLSAPAGQKEATAQTDGPAPGVPGPAPEASGSTPGAPGPALESSGPAPGAPGPAPESTGPALPGPLSVDFEKIYKYLASVSRGNQGPELSAAEAAVVLDLLQALPQELPRLPCGALTEHLLDAYAHLTAPQPHLDMGSPEPGSEDAGAPPQAPEDTGPGAPGTAWQATGVCPLNPFLVPLGLLGQVDTPVR